MVVPAIPSSSSTVVSVPSATIEVEVRLSDGGYYPAFVQSVESDLTQLTVSFLDKWATRAFIICPFCSWQAPQTVPLPACRLPPVNRASSLLAPPVASSISPAVADGTTPYSLPSTHTHPVTLPPLTPPDLVCVGDVLEAYCRSSANAFASAWHLATVTSTLDRKTYNIKLITRDNERAQVSVDDLRVMNARRTLSPQDVFTHALPIPTDVLERFAICHSWSSNTADWSTPIWICAPSSAVSSATCSSRVMRPSRCCAFWYANCS